MSITNPFEPEHIAQALDLLPNRFSRVGDMGIFDRRPIPTTTVTIVKRQGRLVLLDPTARSGDRQTLNRDLKNSITFDIPTFLLGDTLTPEDIQNVIRFAPGPRQAEQVAEAEARRLQAVRDPHDETFEFFRIAALKGIIIDPLGNTLYNLFNEFAIPKKTVTFTFSDANFDILDATKEITDHIANNLHGETFDGTVNVLCGGTFQRQLNKHPSRTKWIEQHPMAATMLAASRMSRDPNAMRTTEIDGVSFESYTGVFENSAGASLKPVAEDRGYVFPGGTTEMFPEYDAPPNRRGHENVAPNEEIFVSTKELDHAKGIDIDSESNKLPLCTRPDLLIECIAA